MFMTKQELYDATVAHLLKQGCRAMSSGTCAYRAVSGDKCAIGVHIPDNEYVLEIEGTGVLDLTHFWDKGPATYIPTLIMYGHLVGADFLQQLQVLHDDAFASGNTRSFRRNVDAVAFHYKLKPYFNESDV